MEKITWHTKRWKIEDLKPFEGNPRKATEKQVGDVKESLVRFNLAEPIVINTGGTIIGGRLRVKILKEQGVKEVYVKVPDRTLILEEMMELNLRLNKNQE